MPLMTPQIQKVLYAETDARFQAQTGYAPGRKLDPKNKTDAALIPVWIDAYNKVKAEWAKGKLVTTYDHPAVAVLIADAATDFANAAKSVAAALGATDSSEKNAHAADAAAFHAKANAATTKAATYQPPTVSPELAQHAANQVATQVMTAPAPHGQESTAPQAAPIGVGEALDALQSSHAPSKAAATQTQTPAPDAPNPPESSIGSKLALAGGIVVAIAAAVMLAERDDKLYSRTRTRAA